MKLLQSIDLCNCQRLVKLPSGIVKLRQLRRLNLLHSGINSIPRGFGSLTNLRILKGFQAEVEGDWCSLEELGPLNQLMHLRIDGLENVTTSAFAIKAKLGEKVHLRYLSLKCIEGDYKLLNKVVRKIEMVFDELCPAPCIENLDITGYYSERLPRWVTSTESASLRSLRILTMENLPWLMDLPNGLWYLPSLEFLQIKTAPFIKRVGPEFLLPYLGSDLKIEVIRCWGLERICNLPILHNLVIIECPGLKVLEHLPTLQRLTLMGGDMETLPGYLQDVNPRLLDLHCDVSLPTSIAKGESGPEWDKFSHIKQVKAYADDNNNNIDRKWYVKYTRDPFSFQTNISPSAHALEDKMKEVSLDEVEEISNDEISLSTMKLQTRKLQSRKEFSRLWNQMPHPREPKFKEVDH